MCNRVRSSLKKVRIVRNFNTKQMTCFVKVFITYIASFIYSLAQSFVPLEPMRRVCIVKFLVLIRVAHYTYKTPHTSPHMSQVERCAGNARCSSSCVWPPSPQHIAHPSWPRSRLPCAKSLTLCHGHAHAPYGNCSSLSSGMETM